MKIVCDLNLNLILIITFARRKNACCKNIGLGFYPLDNNSTALKRKKLYKAEKTQDKEEC